MISMAKHFFLMAIFVFLGQFAWAQDESDSGVTIIDPSLMNKGVWAEPYFRAPGESPRETASQEAIASAATNEKSPQQYLDVLEKIPSSQPTIQRSWVEHKALSED